MSIKRLQRYDIDAGSDLIPDIEGCCCLTDDVTELEATNAELYKALDELLSLGGDEYYEAVLRARKVLASARGE